ncbi:protegrin-2-like [Ambystoma mexicanum]|uniref:protegrin-2-like n=1 Tax=Ambystoma mexicanum TaxID=8296 RepID=UPI0037E805B4
MMAWPVLLLFAIFAVDGPSAAPLSESRPTPKDVAGSAVEVYNQQTSTDVVFKFHQLRNVKRKTFIWGVHFSINFTIKETDCRKPLVYNVQDCKYRSKAKVKDCFAEATVLDFMDEAPLTSVECHQRQVAKPKKPASPNRKKPTSRRQPEVPLEDEEVKVQHYISSYSMAALSLQEPRAE